MKSLEQRVSEEIARRTKNLSSEKTIDELFVLSMELEQSVKDCDLFTERLLDIIDLE